MKIQIRDPQFDEPWTDVSSWFKAYIDLGVRLSKLSKLPSFNVSKILLMVPKREFVTAAIALGVSIEKHLSGEQIGREINKEELLELPEGEIVRLKWKGIVWDIALLSVERSKTSKDDVDIIVKGTIDGAVQKLNLRAVLNCYVMPEGFPEGKHHVLTVTRGASLVVRSKQADLHAKNPDQLKWETQAAPGLAIFGDIGHFQEQLACQITYPALERIFQTRQLTIEEVTRVDFVSDDKFAHFVNLFEQVNNFPKFGSTDYRKVEMCEWVLLDGNNATARLAGKELLIDNKTIAIVEVGVPRSQGRALESFMNTLNNFSELDVEKHLAWTPPPGAYIWGWSS